MARDLTSGMETAIDGARLSPIFLIKAEFDSGDLRFWTGYNEITYDAEVYTGAGTLLDVQEVSETQDLIANNTTLELEAISSALISLALDEDYQGRPITIWFGCLDDNGALIADPYMVFKGFMDVMVIDGVERIILDCENELVKLRKSKERRYTDEDQKAEYSGDRGFEFVALSQDVQLTWGAGQ